MSKLVSSRYERAKGRLEAAHQRRKKARVQFLVKLANRKNMRCASRANGDAMCQAGYTQIVKEVRRLGGVNFYRSCACGGCDRGANFIDLWAGGDLPVENVNRCALVENNWVITTEDVQPGQLVRARDPMELERKVAVARP